jgi:hypothetical protein
MVGQYWGSECFRGRASSEVGAGWEARVDFDAILSLRKIESAAKVVA